MAVVAIRQALLIVNPGARRARTLVNACTSVFQSAGVDVIVRETTRAGHATELARDERSTADAVFSLGGDGTAMEVLGALRGTGIPVGVLPGGTGNLVARALGTPMRVERAVRALLSGTTRDIDLGELPDGRVFAFGAGMGVDVTMLEQASSELKRRMGVLAYVRAAVHAAFAREDFDVTATVDGVRHQFRAAGVLVLNFGNVLGGLLQLGPGVDPADGLLDLCVYSPRTIGETLDIGVRIVRHRLGEGRHMHFLKGRHIVLEAGPERRSQADGELLARGTFECRVQAHAARVLAPGVA